MNSFKICLYYLLFAFKVVSLSFLVLPLNCFYSKCAFMSFSFSLSLTVLHTGKRWFIICPVAETPMLDKEKTTSHTSTSQGMLHTHKFTVSVLLLSCLQIYYLPHEIL